MGEHCRVLVPPSRNRESRRVLVPPSRDRESRRERPGLIPLFPRAAVRAALPGCARSCPPCLTRGRAQRIAGMPRSPPLRQSCSGPHSGGFRGSRRGLHCWQGPASLTHVQRDSGSAVSVMPCHAWSVAAEVAGKELRGVSAPSISTPPLAPGPLRHHRTHPNTCHPFTCSKGCCGLRARHTPMACPISPGTWELPVPCDSPAALRPVGLRITPDPALILHRCNCWFPNNLNCFQHPLPCLGSALPPLPAPNFK